MENIFRTYLEAADHVAELLEDAETAKRWDDPSALRGFSVGGLAAHLMQGVALINHLLDVPEEASDAPLVSLAEYTASFKMEDFDADIHAYLRRIAEKSATYGPARTTARFRDLVAALRDRLQTESTHRILDLRPTLPWGISLEDRVRLNLMDLVVHADDLAVSLGRSGSEAPEAASSVAIDALMGAARYQHGDTAVIRALSRRERSAEEVFPVL
jgi:mycothiol maleylpyruvate isomerase-like protein